MTRGSAVAGPQGQGTGAEEVALKFGMPVPGTRVLDSAVGPLTCLLVTHISPSEHKPELAWHPDCSHVT